MTKLNQPQEEKDLKDWHDDMSAVDSTPTPTDWGTVWAELLKEIEYDLHRSSSIHKMQDYIHTRIQQAKEEARKEAVEEIPDTIVSNVVVAEGNGYAYDLRPIKERIFNSLTQRKE